MSVSHDAEFLLKITNYVCSEAWPAMITIFVGEFQDFLSKDIPIAYEICFFSHCHVNLIYHNINF